MSKRIHIFNPGPAALPSTVIEQIQAEMADFSGTGMSILEISHRSPQAETILADCQARLRRLLGLRDDYRIVFLPGGASMQFHMIPRNFLTAGSVADYINTGTWATKAMAEAKVLGNRVNVAASSEDRDFCYIPKAFHFNPDAVYVHLTSNNTIRGTQFSEYPDTEGVPLISDMSSDILSRPINVSKFGMIYAGAQKNLGPAGIALVIIRQEMLERVQVGLPNMMSYQVHASKNSMYNTPNVFAIYVVGLVVKWLEETFGDLKTVAGYNEAKAQLLYGVLDADGFYRPTADKDSRSMMNVTFRLPSVDLEKAFISEATANGLVGIKGHRSVGGCRASLYNAVSLESVQALTDFMKDFQRRQG